MDSAELIHAARMLLQERTGFGDFETMGCHGLWRESPGEIEILAIHATVPGTGQCRRFIAEMKTRYPSVCVWSIWNPNLRAALKRYGFKRSKRFCTRTGDILEGMRWTR